MSNKQSRYWLCQQSQLVAIGHEDHQRYFFEKLTTIQDTDSVINDLQAHLSSITKHNIENHNITRSNIYKLRVIQQELIHHRYLLEHFRDLEDIKHLRKSVIQNKNFVIGFWFGIKDNNCNIIHIKQIYNPFQ